jgi:hypothetical protein
VSTDFEELVVDSMRRFTAVVDVPADLADRARWQHRRRRTRARATAATGAAIVSAAVVIAVTAGTSGPAPRRSPQAQTAAYIVGRAEQALSNRNVILELTTPRQVITRTATDGKTITSNVARSVHWGYHSQGREQTFAAYLRGHGQPGASDTDTADSPLRPGPGILFHFTQTSVNYTDRTWSRGPQVAGKASGTLGPACPMLRSMENPRADGIVLFTSPPFIKAALACGGLSVTGRVRIDGTTAIRLTGSRAVTKLPLVIYISPVTYRLVRTVIGGLRQDFRWLAPTPAHLAQLRVVIPPGFHRVRDAAGPLTGGAWVP